MSSMRDDDTNMKQDSDGASEEGERSLEAPQATPTPSIVEADQPVVPTTESELPPEARGEANGAPLGCCLGVTTGLLLSLIIVVLSRLYADPLASLLGSNLTTAVRVALIVVGLAAAIIFGYLGWRIGKRAYREYELSPQQKERLARLEHRYQKQPSRASARRRSSS